MGVVEMYESIVKPMLSFYESVVNAAACLGLVLAPARSPSVVSAAKPSENQDPVLAELHGRLCHEYAVEEHRFLSREPGVKMPEPFGLITVRLLRGYGHQIFTDVQLEDGVIDGDAEATRFNVIGSFDDVFAFRKTIEERIVKYGAEAEIGCGILRRTGRVTSVGLPEYTALPERKGLYVWPDVQAGGQDAASLEEKAKRAESNRVKQVVLAHSFAA